MINFRVYILLRHLNFLYCEIKCENLILTITFAQFNYNKKEKKIGKIYESISTPHGISHEIYDKYLILNFVFSNHSKFRKFLMKFERSVTY